MTEPTDAPLREGQVVTRRRAPRYRAFGVTGAIVGLAIGLALALTRDIVDTSYSMTTIAGYFAVPTMFVGALIGLGVAILVERRR